MLQFSPCVYYRELWRSASPQGQGLAPMSIPSTPGRSRTARSTGAAPGLSIAYFLGNQAGPRLAQDVGPRASLAQHSPCLGRENQRLSMLSSLGKGMMVLGMMWAPGLCGRPQRGWAGTVRAGGALRALIHISHCCFTFTLLIYCTNLLSKLSFMFLVTDESVLQHARSFCL